jgi:pimeloyl-ACP methyl ester carboxylesterase
MPDEGEPGFFQPYGIDYILHAYGLMLGRSYLGRRVYDVLCTLDLLVHEGAQSVHLYGRGQGALLALYAALFHEGVVEVVLKNGPRSYAEWAQTPLVTWPSTNTVRDVLKFYDLPDCVRALGGRVRVVEPWGPEMGPAADD